MRVPSAVKPMIFICSQIKNEIVAVRIDTPIITATVTTLLDQLSAKRAQHIRTHPTCHTSYLRFELACLQLWIVACELHFFVCIKKLWAPISMLYTLILVGRPSRAATKGEIGALPRAGLPFGRTWHLPRHFWNKYCRKE